MRYAIFSFFLLLTFLPFGASAHPHAWIDMETTVVFDDRGNVTGVRVGWLFDDFYSAFSMDGVEASQENLNELAETNLKNLSEYAYFTEITADDKKQALAEVHDYNTRMIGKRLWLEFYVPLKQPINPKKQKLGYAVFDPTYYVEILHKEEGENIHMEGNTQGCGYQLNPPKPPEDMAMMAAALDKTQSAGDGIGKFFSEHVTLLCD